MTPSIHISHSFIEYLIPEVTPYSNKPWRLSLSEIKIIGFVNCLVFDDDSDFLVFVDKNANRYVMNCSSSIEGWGSFESRLQEVFGVKIPANIYNRDMVLYPASYFGQPLYKSSLTRRILRDLSRAYAVEGELSDDVLSALRK